MRRQALLALMAFCLKTAPATATEFEPLNRAIAKALGTTKAVRTKVTVGKQDLSVYSPSAGADSPDRYAVAYSALYPPNCTHTWVIALSAAGRVQQIRVVEMGCPHAFPARKSSFLDQYVGKGPAPLSKLGSGIQAVAKATGTCDLTTQAVNDSIAAVSKLRRN